MKILIFLTFIEADLSYYKSFAVALVKGLNNGARSKRENSRKFSDGPFSFPRQPRSVRQRVCLSIESNSE